jgi:hypothetical protein
MAIRPRTLRLPFRSRWTTITLKSEFTPEQAIQRLRAAAAASDAGEGLLAVTTFPLLDLIAPLASNELSDACTPDSSLPSNWPFDRAAVREALEVATAFFAKERSEQPARSVIRVADTGVTGLGEPSGFPPALLAVNRQARPGDRTPDRTGFAGAYYGIDADGGGDVTPRVRDPNGGHGTQVANLALGGIDFRTEYGAVARLLGLSTARLFTDRYNVGVWVNPTTLISSLNYELPLAHIINLSVGGPEPIPSLVDPLMKLFEYRQLVVMAAGNEGKNLAHKSMWPAAFASSERGIRSALLVVGAHGPIQSDNPLTRAPFSNYGRNYVDLLAPGCRLPAAFGEAGTLAGTSFAAPLVAFTAGLVRDFLLEPQSVDIRNRLWASSRWVSKGVEKETLFGGILDIPAALRIFDDTVRLRGGALLPGRWLESDRFEPCKDTDAVPPKWVLRVRVELQDEDLPRLHLLLRDVNGVVEEAPACTAAGEDGPQLRFDSGEKRTFRWREIEALIPAVDLTKRRIPPDGPQPAGIAVSPANQVTITKEVQAALVARGASLVPDGRLGSETRAAIRDFQRGRFEAPTGVLTEVQQRVLLGDIVK